MYTDKKAQARDLFAQTDLTKTQIASILGISRTTLHGWVREGNWDRLKRSAEHLPSILAEKCYLIFGQLADNYLSERRLTNPISFKEAETLHRIMLTIQKMRNRNTVNESMEMFALFQDILKKENPGLAGEVFPYIEKHLSSRASVYTHGLLPANFTKMGRIPFDPPGNIEEEQLDYKDFFDWDVARMEATGSNPYLCPQDIPAQNQQPEENTPRPQNETTPGPSQLTIPFPGGSGTVAA